MSYSRIRLSRRAMVSIAPVSIGLVPVGLIALFLLYALAPAPASAQVKRCERSDGTAAFTDGRCSAIDAVDATAREPGGDRPGSRRLYRGGCARNVHDLLFEMTTAIDAGDANRLSGVYHWPGTSSRAAVAVMAQLDEVVRKPLVDIVPVLPSAWRSADTSVPGRADGWTSSANAPTVSAGGPAANAAGAPPVPNRGYQYPSTVDQMPIALRLVQTLDNGSTPSETMFDIHRHFGCVWIKAG